jgi:biotin synthase-related radical SAM superfamily protein
VWEVKTIEILIVSIFKSNSSVKNVLKRTTKELGVPVTLCDCIREVLVRISA